jgi:hypothetical protein
MLKAPRRLHLLVIVATAFTATAFAGSIAAGSALADGGHQWESNETPPTLNGDWAPLNRCPVDDPTMLSANGTTNIPVCLAVTSPSGSLTIGGLTIPTKATNLQLGLNLTSETGATAIVSPPNGAVLDESIEIPNGLQGLICPSPGRLAWRVCRPPRNGESDNEHSHELTDLTISVVSAGAPSNFNLGAGLGLNEPIVSVPVKIHLQNRLLGDRCYIGSDAEPIVTQPENTGSPTISFEAFDANGTPDPAGPMADLQLQGSQSTSSFAIPTATHCGFAGIFDNAIDGHLGLPSAAGNNKLVFNETSSHLVLLNIPEEFAPNAGKQLSENWHSAVLPEENEEGHHGHGHGHGH